MKKNVIFLMIITIISSLFGFGRDIILAYFYGASSISDAYIIATTIPTVIFGFIGVGISTGYIPMYRKLEEEKGIESSNYFTNNLLNILLVLLTIVVILGLLFTDYVVSLFASGFDNNMFLLTVKMTKISLFGIYFSCLISIFKGFLHVKGNFVIPGLIGLPMNLIIIVTIYISFETTPTVLAIGTLIGAATQIVLILPVVYKNGFRYKAIINIKDKSTQKLGRLAVPTIIVAAVDQINIIVDRTIASQIVIGGISALTYSARFTSFIQGVFVSSIVTVLYPTISKIAAQGNISGFKRSLTSAIVSMNMLIIPASVGSIIFSNTIIELLFGRGEFDSEGINMTSNALLFYLVGMIGYGLREILSRAFYSIQDTKTPMVNSFIAICSNIILNIVLSKYMGISGIALATSISSIICSFLLLNSLRKKVGSFDYQTLLITHLKILLSSSMMGFISYISFNLLTNNFGLIISLSISIFLGILTYTLLLYLLKLQELNEIVISILKRFRIR